MSKKSLKEVLKTEYYNYIYRAVAKWLSDSSENANLQNEYNYVRLEDVDIVFINVSDLPGTSIDIDIVVDATLVGVNHSRNYGAEEDYESQWFKLRCSADVCNGLNNFRISEIEVYRSRRVVDNPMSDSLVPILYKHQLDSEAEKFLEKFYPEALKTPQAVDIKLLTERMGIEVKPAHLSSNCSVFGMTLFTDGMARTYCPDTNSYREIDVKAGTILYDPEVYFMRSLGSVRNTIAHECVHWHFHKKAMELERIFNPDANKIKCYVQEITPVDFQQSKKRNPLEWMEWQANALAPRILMPYEMFSIRANHEFKEAMKQNQTSKRCDVVEEVIQQLANFFEVSKLAAKIRLLDIGYEEAKGAFVYHVDNYLPLHSFAQGAVKNNQVFHCSLIDVAFAYSQSAITDGRLSRLLDQRSLIYVDFCVVINDPQYVEKQTNGRLCLTTYAMKHMDECCLKFDVTYKKVATFDSSSYQDLALYKKLIESLLPEVTFSLTENGQVIDRAEGDVLLADHAQKVATFVQRLPNSFSQSLRELMDGLDFTDELLAEKSDCDPKTISRYKNQESYTKSKKKVIAICVGMRLPQVIAEDLLRKAGHPLGFSEEDILIRLLFNANEYVDIHDWNDRLKVLKASIPSK